MLPDQHPRPTSQQDRRTNTFYDVGINTASLGNCISHLLSIRGEQRCTDCEWNELHHRTIRGISLCFGNFIDQCTQPHRHGLYQRPIRRIRIRHRQHRKLLWLPTISLLLKSLRKSWAHRYWLRSSSFRHNLCLGVHHRHSAFIHRIDPGNGNHRTLRFGCIHWCFQLRHSCVATSFCVWSAVTTDCSCCGG